MGSYFNATTGVNVTGCGDVVGSGAHNVSIVGNNNNVTGYHNTVVGSYNLLQNAECVAESKVSHPRSRWLFFAPSAGRLTRSASASTWSLARTTFSKVISASLCRTTHPRSPLDVRPDSPRQLQHSRGFKQYY